MIAFYYFEQILITIYLKHRYDLKIKIRWMRKTVLKDLMIRSSSFEFLIFERQTYDRGIQVRFEDGNLWLTQKSIVELLNEIDF